MELLLGVLLSNNRDLNLDFQKGIIQFTKSVVWLKNMGVGNSPHLPLECWEVTRSDPNDKIDSAYEWWVQEKVTYCMNQCL